MIVFSVCLFAFAVDVAGGRILVREERKWRDATLQQRELLRTYRREFVVGDSRDQNAAIWYRLAFEKLGSRTADTHREILPLLMSATRPGANGIESAYRDWCAEAESPRVLAALACTHCDWELAYDFRVNPSSEGWFQAMVLVECLALNGSRHLERGDWVASARAFLTTLAVASDFSQGSLEMNVVAVTAAQWAVRGFAESMSRIDDASMIDRLAEQFAQLEAVMPSFRVGLRQQEL